MNTPDTAIDIIDELSQLAATPEQATSPETSEIFRKAAIALTELRKERRRLPVAPNETNPFRNGKAEILNFMHILADCGVEDFPWATTRAWAREAAEQITALREQPAIA